MNSADLITMIGNVSRSLFPVQHLLSGVAYLLGILFFITAITKLKKMAESTHSQEKMFVPIAYMVGGATLLFLPSTVQLMSNTTFGTGNILQYANYSPYNIYSAMSLMIQTAGLIWFIRGCVLLVTSSAPGVQHGPKGLAFLCAGVLAMNFESTTAVLNTVMGQLEALSLSIKTSQGY